MTDDSYPCPNCGGDTSRLADVHICMECPWDSTRGVTEMTNNSELQITKRDLFEKCVDEQVQLLEELDELVDKMDREAEKSLEREETAYCAYERCAGNIMYLIQKYRGVGNE